MSQGDQVNLYVWVVRPGCAQYSSKRVQYREVPFTRGTRRTYDGFRTTVGFRMVCT